MTIATTTAQELKQWLDAGQAVLIDVREPSEYAEAAIEGAILMPLGGIHAADLPPLGDKKLVIQCKAGGRSLQACQKLVMENPDLKPINLTGGILAWAAANLPIK
ncbi:MAG: rhodanese-like domain-containing protein [Alphaproteobacteria bacterium]|nr:rhodanese-like domain-containing protein [Alphaproteobacteria bacterium]